MPLESKISCYKKQDTSFIKQWNFQIFLWFFKLIAGVSLDLLHIEMKKMPFQT